MNIAVADGGGNLVAHVRMATNICGSDQHMVRGRTTAPPGLVLGHEITGEVIEAGRDVQFIGVGDLVSVPFNVALTSCPPDITAASVPA